MSFKTALERSEEMYVPKKHKIHGQGSEKTEVNEIMKDKRATMLKQIKQFQLFKEILDRNSQQLTISDSGQKFKTVDCKLLHNIFSDLHRQKVQAKVKNDGFLFIERSDARLARGNKQPQGAIQRIDSALPSSVAILESRKLEKIQRNLFKKFYHQNTSRMLHILGYQTTHSDEKKFLHSN